MSRDFIFGEAREDGRIFGGYRSPRSKSQRIEEVWHTPEAWLRARIGLACRNAKLRADKYNVPFNLNIDFLASIFPEDMICPALDILMVWGEPRSNSPSLDRIVPEVGYVRGNVQWLSMKANWIKTNATAEEIIRVADFLLLQESRS